jgi:hypothetical protein
MLNKRKAIHSYLFRFSIGLTPSDLCTLKMQTSSFLHFIYFLWFVLALKASRPWLVLVINDNVMLYVTNICFAETNGKLGCITGRSTTTVKTIPEIRTRSDD